MTQDSMSIGLSNKIYEGNYHQIRVRHEFGKVIVFIDESRLEMNTPISFKTGYSLCQLAGQAIDKDYVSWKINSKELQLLPEHALKVGGAILRKTDDADDFQLNRGNLK